MVAVPDHSVLGGIQPCGRRQASRVNVSRRRFPGSAPSLDGPQSHQGGAFSLRTAPLSSRIPQPSLPIVTFAVLSKLASPMRAPQRIGPVIVVPAG